MTVDNEKQVENGIPLSEKDEKSNVQNGNAALGQSREELDWGVDKTDENKERGNWSGKLDFFLSCVGYAVGIGNVWRFPYLCFRNGGGAFLIPYMFALFVCGIPLFFMETAIGQFSSCGAIEIWRLAPIFKGVGIGTVVVTSVLCVYYNIILSWSLFYMFKSFARDVPWKTCGNWWNSIYCLDRTTGENKTFFDAFTNTTVKPRTPSEEFWERYILDVSDGIENPDGVRWQMFLALAVAWIIVFCCVCRGVKSSGKVVYFTATFPYVILLILLIRGVTLPGASAGVKFYLKPNFKLLRHYKVWGEACIQIFYSLGPGWGGLITMASYNRFRNNVLRDSYMVPLINSGTSILAGFVVFSVVGNMAHVANVEVKDVVASGPGLAFVVYPEALSLLPISPLWAVLFFFMLLTLGLDSQFVMIETVVTAISDEFHHITRRWKRSKLFILIVCCLIMFLLGLSMTTRGGAYVFYLLDWYAAGYSVMVISLCEVVAIGWIYGPLRLLDEVEFMVDMKLNIVVKYIFVAMWMVVVPFVLIFILITTAIVQTTVTYGGYTYPQWTIGIGWVVAIMSMIPIPLYAIYYCIRQKGSFEERLYNSIKEQPGWGPAVEPYKTDYAHMLSRRKRLFFDGIVRNLFPQSRWDSRASAAVYDNPVVIQQYPPYDQSTKTKM